MISYPADYREELAKRGICAVMAIAICAEVDFDIAFAAARRTYDGKRWRGGMAAPHILRCLAEVGCEFADQTLTNKGEMLQDWVLLRADPEATYIVWSCNHAVTVRGRHVADQAHNGHIREFRYRRMRVQGWARIIANKPVSLELAA